MKKQTAVEWLVEQIDPNLLVTEKVRLAVQQAKAMEKEQIIDSFMNGADVGDMFNNEGRAFITDAEQYYNQTYDK